MTVSINGNEIGTTEMMAVPYAISAGYVNNLSAYEVQYDNAISGLGATTTQDAIDELVSGGIIDADSDPSNEFQRLSFDALTNKLSLSDGNSIIIPTGGTDADADPTNELQTISFDATSNKISLTDGGEITIPSGGTDADADPANELQTLSFDAGTNELSLSDGNSVTIPSGGTDADADPENEIDVTRRQGLLVGDDGIVDGLIGTADGQVVKWDAALGSWVAGTDDTSVGGGSGSTGFETLDEGNGPGWRLIDRNTENYGPIGLNAFDASTNAIATETRGATGLSATAFGEETTASGPRSTAMGYGTKATGSVSIAVGEETEASGEFAVAMGDRTLASEQSSTAFGSGTRAINTHATAMGESTTASGKSATSTGIGTRAESLASFVVGRNNIGGGNAFEWRPDDPLFEVGNGGDLLPGNALTVLKNGKVGIGLHDPKATQHVHADSFESNTRYTTGDSGDGFADGFYVGLVNDLGFGFTGTINNNEKGPLRLGTDGTSHLNITKDGNVGIGVYNPSIKLEVDGNIKSTSLEGTGQRNVMADTDGNLVIGRGGEGSLWTANESNIHYEGGNVGIGTASPVKPFHVVGNIENSIRLESAAEKNWVSYFSSNGYIGYSGVFTGNNDMDFGTGLFNTIGKVHLTTGATPKLTVVPNGNVGIGTTDPSEKLEVQGNIKTSGELHSNSTGSANLLPIAYGRIEEDGTITSGTDNFNVTKTSVGNYVLNLDDTIDNNRNLTIVTSPMGFPLVPAVGYFPDFPGRFSVALWNLDADPRDGRFTFVVYKE